MTDLTKEELRKLTEIIHIDTTRSDETKEIVEYLILGLPKHMRCDRWSRTNKALCDAHRGLNAELMHDLFELVQREVGCHLVKYDAYPELLKPLDKLILKRLRAIRGMWENPDSNDETAAHIWRHEASGCQGCMLARVANDRDALRNLRTALLARTQTRANHAPRRLMKFVDGCIDQFPDHLDEMYNTSSQFAYILKATRKACAKAWYRDPVHGASRRRYRRHRRKNRQTNKDDKTEPGENSKEGQVQAPPVILTPHPAELYVADSSCVVSPNTDTDDKGSSKHQVGSKKVMNSSDTRTRPSTCRDTPQPDHVTRLMGFVEGRYQGFQESVCAESGEPTRYLPVDAVDEVAAMHRRNMGQHPYQDSHAVPLVDFSSDDETDEDDPNA